MGLFDKRDKKRKDDFDSPMESIDLSQVAADRSGPVERTEAKSEPAAPAAPAAASSSGPVAAPAAPTRTSRPMPAAAPPMPAPDTGSYGIDKAIELMRTLPTENIQLVVQVVKFSLESVGIKLPDIIEDAIRRQNDLRGRVDVLKSEIADLEAEIKQRKEEIERHETDHRETTTVRERLEMAESLNKAAAEKTAAPAAPASASSSDKNPVPAAPKLPASAAAPATLGPLGSSPAKK